MSYGRKNDMSFGAALTIITALFVGLAAWVTHIIWIIAKLAGDEGATVGQMVLGAIGAFMPPIGVVHGVMIWFGFGG